MDTMTGYTVATFVLALAGTGVVAGILAGLLGVGGGIVIVPVLFYVFMLLEIDPAVRMHLAVGTSRAVIVPTSLRSARAHYMRDTVDGELLRSLLPGLVVGVFAGILLSAVVSGAVLTAVFGSVAMLVALNMARAGAIPKLAAHRPGAVAAHGIGGFVGMVSTLMGIGGGTLSVPLLDALRYPIHRSVGTAAAIGTVISIPGALGFIWSGWGNPDLPPFSLGYVSLLGFALIAPLAVLCAPWGVRLGHSLDTRKLKLAFAAFLMVTAINMLYTALSA